MPWMDMEFLVMLLAGFDQEKNLMGVYGMYDNPIHCIKLD
jgi:hypothetical protein